MILFIVTKAAQEAQNIFSFFGRAMQEIVERHFNIQYMPFTLAQFSAQELLIVCKNTFRLEFLHINLASCCVTKNSEKVLRILVMFE